MKRTSPPQRRTPLTARTPMRRTAKAPTRTRGRSRVDSLAYADLRHQVHARAAGRCERCGRLLVQAFEAHHRRLRSQGGPDDVTNLACLCPACHAWCHAHPQQAQASGWIVRRGGAGPANVPVTLHTGAIVRLDADGGYDVVFEAGAA